MGTRAVTVLSDQPPSAPGAAPDPPASGLPEDALTHAGVPQAGAPHGSQPGPGAPGGRFRRALSRGLGAVPPPLLVLVAILSIQIGAAFAVGLFPALGPNGVVFLRVLISAVLLGLLWRPRLDPELCGQLKAHAGLLLAFGLVIAGMNLCFYQAIARIPLGIAVTIEFVGPLALAVATSRRLPEFLWILLAAAGLLLLTPDIGGNLDPLGVAFALGGAAGWAGFVLIAKRAGQVFDSGIGLTFGMAAAAVMLLPFGAEAVPAALAAPALLLGVLAVALLSTTIPWSLEFEALKRMPARSYGVLVTLEPAAAVAIGILLLGETLTWATALAVACVTAAALGVTLHDRKGGGAGP